MTGENQNIVARRRHTLTACCVTHCLQDGLTAVLFVLLPIIAQVFGLNYTQVGILRGISATGMSLVELPSGILSERYGERRLITFGLLATGTGYLLLEHAYGLWSLAILLFVIGVGGGFQHTLCSTLVIRAYHQKGGRGALGTYNAFGDIGKLIFSGILGITIGAGIAWQQVTTTFGLITIALGIGVFLILLRTQFGGVQTAPPASPTMRQRWGVKNKTGFIGVLSISFLDGMVQAGFLTFVAFLMLEKSVSPFLASFAIVLTLAGGIIGKYFCGHLADRLGAFQALMLTQGLNVVAIIAVIISPTVVSFVLLVFLGIFLQGSSSIYYAHVGDVFTKERQGRGFGLVYSNANFAAVIGPIVFGVVADSSNLTVAILAMALCILVTIPLCYLLKHKKV